MLECFRLPHLFLSYDIMCQYIKKFFNRLPETEVLNQLKSGGIKFDVAVPKFHLPAHVRDCHADFSLNHLPGAGRVDGEAPERVWPITNQAAACTIDMGPGARKDTLNGIFGAANWRKVTRFGELFIVSFWFVPMYPGRSLLSKLRTAISQRERQQEVYRANQEGWKTAKDEVDRWEAEVRIWESRTDKWNAELENPYRPRAQRMSSL
jgi:hypothetical protein